MIETKKTEVRYTTSNHIVPFSRGESYELSNLATSCRMCNRQKKDKSIEDFYKWRWANE